MPKELIGDREPINWPGNIKLPTIEECEAAVAAGEEMIRQMERDREGRLLRTDPEMPRIVVDSS